mmetsp:Transcript_85518/g.151348  ORF Transcript_85518/g.151348 Transcript_85518/m.151348 type:complete len:228 (+) Transcript_85518:1573-2256(+)
MVTHKDNLLGTHHDGNEALWLCSLSGFVAKNLLETEVLQPRISCTHTCSANDIGGRKQLSFSRVLQLFELLLVSVRELTELVFQREQLLQLLVIGSVQVTNLVMQSQEIHTASYRFTGLGTETHHLEARLVQLLSKLINGDVGWCANKDLSLILASEVVDNGGAGNGLASTWRTLDQAQWVGQGLPHSVDLGVIQGWQVRCCEVLWHICPDGLRLNIMAQELVVEIT